MLRPVAVSDSAGAPGNRPGCCLLTRILIGLFVTCIALIPPVTSRGIHRQHAATASFHSGLHFLAFMTFALLMCSWISTAAETGAPVPPEMFGDDYYKVYGTPDLTVSLEIRMALVVFFTLSFAAATLVLQREVA